MCAYEINTKQAQNRTTVDSLINTRGCLGVIGGWLGDHLCVVGVLGVAVGVLELVCVGFTALLVRDVRRQRAKWDSPRGTQELLFDHEVM